MTTETGTLPVSGGLELYYEIRRDAESDGRGDATVVVPSLSWVARDMDDLAPGRTVVFYDIRGRGRSSAIVEDAQLALERDVEDLETLRRTLALERMSLLGWSYHGALSARYALAHPDRVERLLLVGSTAPCEEPFWMDFLESFGMKCDLESLQTVEKLKRSGAKERDPVAYCKAVHDVFFRAYVADNAALDRMKSCPCVEPNVDADRVNDQGRRLLEKLGSYDWREEFRALQTPTLILHGIEDPVVLAGSEEWDRILPNSRLEAWENVGHMPWIEVPERFFPLANDFFAGRDAVG